MTTSKTIFSGILLAWVSLPLVPRAMGQTAGVTPVPPKVTQWDKPLLRSSFRAELDENEKVAGLFEVWSEVKYNFANFDHVPELDWDAICLAYLPKVKAAGSTLEYYQLLAELVARLRDGHTNVNPPAELAARLYARPPLETALVEDRVLVTRVWDDRLRQADIVPGVEIIAVAGVPVRQFAEERIMPYQSSSTRQDLGVRAYTYALLKGAANENVTLTLRDSSGATFQRLVPRGDYPDTSRPPTPSVAFKVLDGNVGYLALNSFEDENAPQMFDALYPEIEKTDALILDVRANGGGSGEIGYTILGCFTDQDFAVSRWRTRQYRPVSRAWGEGESWYSPLPETWKANGLRFYQKRVVLLTGPRTFSAAEDFCVAFDSLKRGQIIGEPTGGSTGQPLHFSLPGGGTGRVCAKHDFYPDGREFIGIGVQPHRVVHPTVADVRAGQDTVLTAALMALAEGR